MSMFTPPPLVELGERLPLYVIWNTSYARGIEGISRFQSAMGLDSNRSTFNRENNILPSS